MAKRPLAIEGNPLLSEEFYMQPTLRLIDLT